MARKYRVRRLLHSFVAPKIPTSGDAVTLTAPRLTVAPQTAGLDYLERRSRLRRAQREKTSNV
ncbi:hypothetical protein ACIPY3_04510 [Paenarthrobacter sp. NPDC089714]|uniref:hypothetical protein n=1 Tax=Paenarthrobacter sp. NPDC089714 TaxID=3364377 RepID=UPI003822A52B